MPSVPRILPIPASINSRTCCAAEIARASAPPRYRGAPGVRVAHVPTDWTSP